MKHPTSSVLPVCTICFKEVIPGENGSLKVYIEDVPSEYRCYDHMYTNKAEKPNET